MKYIKITTDVINPEMLIDLVKRSSAGAINVFIGTVRNATKEKSVRHLEFEAYEPMALKEMGKIADQAAAQWPVEAVAIYHRVGKLTIGDIPVVIAVATPHRLQGFEACQYIIDTLKQTVPIWKKEVFEDGEEWVAAHP